MIDLRNILKKKLDEPHYPKGTQVHSPKYGNGEILYYDGQKGYEVLWWNNHHCTTNVFTVKWESKADEARFKLLLVEYQLQSANEQIEKAKKVCDELEYDKKKLIKVLGANNP